MSNYKMSSYQLQMNQLIQLMSRKPHSLGRDFNMANACHA